MASHFVFTLHMHIPRYFQVLADRVIARTSRRHARFLLFSNKSLLAHGALMPIAVLTTAPASFASTMRICSRSLVCFYAKAQTFVSNYIVLLQFQ